MKILNEVQLIFDSYDLKPLELGEFKNIYEYLRHNSTESSKYESEKSDIILNQKYANYIPRGWYGFSIGTPIIPEWVDIIDTVLEMCINIDPNFEIHQIKLKFGRICFYVSSEIIEDITDVELLIARKMFDRALIY